MSCTCHHCFSAIWAPTRLVSPQVQRSLFSSCASRPQLHRAAMAMPVACGKAHEGLDPVLSLIPTSPACGGGGVGGFGRPVQRGLAPPPPPSPPPRDIHPLKRAPCTALADAQHLGRDIAREPAPTSPMQLTPPCELLLEPPQCSGDGLDPQDPSCDGGPDSIRMRTRWDYRVVAGDPVCPDTGAVLYRAPWSNPAYLETGDSPDLRALIQAPPPPPPPPSRPSSSGTQLPLPAKASRTRPRQAHRTRFFGDRCECGRYLEFDPTMRPGLSTWCCKDCQGIDRRHSAECNRERSGQHRRRGPPPMTPDWDPWDTNSVEARLRAENLRSPWPRWISPTESAFLKKETKSDRQRRLDGYCA